MDTGMQMYAYDCRWVGHRDVLQRIVVAGWSSLWVRLKVLAVGCQTSPTSIYLTNIHLHHSHPNKKKEKRWAKNTTDTLHFCSVLVSSDIFWHSFLIRPSFFFQILLWPHVSRARWVGAGCSDPPYTQPRLTLMHHSLTGMEERNTVGENRREGCYPSPAAVYCTVDQWSSLAFISQLQQSATWPPHKNCSSEPQSFRSLSLSHSLHLSSLDLKTRPKCKRKTHVQPCAYTHTHSGAFSWHYLWNRPM